MLGFWSWAANFTWSMRRGGFGVRARSRAQAQDGHDLLETGGPELGRPVFGAEEAGLDLFQQDELAEFLFPGHVLGRRE